jgi:hypothetical protein
VPDTEGGEATDEVTEARTSSPTAPATEKSSAKTGAAAPARRAGTATADDESGADPDSGTAASKAESGGDTTTLTIDLDAVLAYGRERAAAEARAGEDEAGDAVVLADADGDRTDTISRDAIKAAIEAADRAEKARKTAEKPTGTASGKRPTGDADKASAAKDDDVTVVADDAEDGTAVISVHDIKAAIEAADRAEDAKKQAGTASGKGRTGTADAAGEAGDAKADDAAVVADEDADGTAVISVHDIKAAIEAADRAKEQADATSGKRGEAAYGRRDDAKKAPAAEAKADDATVVADDDEDGTAVISVHDIKAAIEAADRAKEQADATSGKRGEAAKDAEDDDATVVADEDEDGTAVISALDIKAAIEAADRAKEQADAATGKRGDAGKARAADGARAGAAADAAEDDKTEEKQDSGTDSTSVAPSEMLPERDERERTRKHGDAAPGGTASRVESFPVQQGPAPGGAGRAPSTPRPRPPRPQGPGPIQRPAPGRAQGPAQPTAPAAGPTRPPAKPPTRPPAGHAAQAQAAAAVASPPRPAAAPVQPTPLAPSVPPPSGTSWWHKITGEMRPVSPTGAPGTSGDAQQSVHLGRLARWLPPLLTLEALIMYVLALKVSPGFLRGVDLDQINGLGLISVLPGAALASIVLLLAAFFITLVQNVDRKGVLLFQLAAITFALHGAAALVEDEPRFHTAWVHAGFADYIGEQGKALPGLDARFSWPGFFSVAGFVTRAGDIADFAPILKWTPLVSNLLYLVPFVLILRQIVATTRARWFAALLFVLVQWIGQDYFSPQGFTYLLYLSFVAVVLRWFGRVEQHTGPLPEKGFIRRTLARLDSLTPGELPPQGDPRDRLLGLLLLIGLFAATTATHQVTPFMMLGALTGFILLRRTTLTLALPVLLGTIVLAWLSYQATPYWSGHFDQLFGGIGRIFDNLQENTGDRLEGTDPEHVLVLQTRLGILGVILLLAGIGLLRRLRRGVLDRVAVVLLCIPVLALAMQSYGGEIGLRVYLFALPGSCILASYAFFPNPQLTVDAPEVWPKRGRRLSFLPRLDPVLVRRIATVIAAATSVVLAMAFLVARYGNEKFERVTSDEVAAMHYVYEHDDPSARVLYLVPFLNREVTPTIPWRERDIHLVEYREALAPRDPTQINHLIAQLREMGPQTYLIASRGQASYLELAHGYPADWGKRFREALDRSRQLKRVFESRDAAVYVLRSYPRGTEVPPPLPLDLVGDRGTPLTPYGIGALVVGWIAFFGYEVLRLGDLERTRRARRRFLAVAIPAAVVAVAVVVERFIVLGFAQ